MKKSFAKDYLEILDSEESKKDLRKRPVWAAMVLDNQPLTVLEHLINMWPTHDIRYEGNDGNEDPLMVDMIKGVEVSTVRKDISTGILEMSVEFVKNIDEIERYNAAIRQHNRTWVGKGSPTTVFDPVHGESYAIKDQFVDPVLMQSKQYALPDSAYSNVSSGSLAKARPSILRKSHLLVRYQLRLDADDQFILGYAAYDYEGQVIYYNELTHLDLAYLVRRSVQEMWGNHEVLEAYGNLLDGVSMLINGKKLHICKKDNRFPEFLAQESSKIKNTKVIQALEEKKEVYLKTSNAAAHVMPVLIIIGFICCFFWALFIMGDVTFDAVFESGIKSSGAEFLLYILLEILIKPPIALCVILLIATVFFRKVAQDTERKASELKAHGKFL